jgi:hypothetical protein
VGVGLEPFQFLLDGLQTLPELDVLLLELPAGLAVLELEGIARCGRARQGSKGRADNCSLIH